MRRHRPAGAAAGPLAALVVLLAAAGRAAGQATCDGSAGVCSAQSAPAYGCDPAAGGAKCCTVAGAWPGCPPCPPGAPTPSPLFGCAGELWVRPSSRLADWSFAGMSYGDYALPRLPEMANVKTVFGARGDGVADDTAAFELALQTITADGTLVVPAGTYIITRVRARPPQRARAAPRSPGGRRLTRAPPPLPRRRRAAPQRLDIDKRIFLQGAGAGATVLSFPRSLGEVYGNTWPGGVSQYGWGPGFINFNGGGAPDPSTRLAAVTANAYAGATVLAVDALTGLQPGMVVRIVMDNVDGGLLRSLNQGLAEPTAALNNRAAAIRWASRVKAVLSNPPRIELERALPFSVSTAWRPEMHDWVSERGGMKRNFTGVADMTLRCAARCCAAAALMPRRRRAAAHTPTRRSHPRALPSFPGAAPFAGEYKEAGHNGLYFYSTAHSWVRNVVFENAELGVVFDSGAFNSVENVTFTSTRPVTPAAPFTGTRGIWNKARRRPGRPARPPAARRRAHAPACRAADAGAARVCAQGTSDNLVNGFDFRTRFVGSVTTSSFAVGNVVANGRGTDVSLDLQYGAPAGNLFTNIHLGAASAPFGWVARGQDAAGRNTLWNVRTANDSLVLPPPGWAPATTWVGAENAAMPAGGVEAGWYVESRPDVWPYDLWAAQRRARGRPLPTPVAPVVRGPGYGCLSNGTKCCFATTDPACPRCPPDAGAPSILWGCNGELWSPRGRLGYDWGWAGYRFGATPPVLPVAVNLKTQFGARGDGTTDDTSALLRAIEATPSGAIFMPAGVYVLTSVINIRKPLVLRGEGRDRTVLRFPKSLTDLYGNTWTEGSWKGVSQYSHGTGLINMGGWDPTGRDFTRLTAVTAVRAGAAAWLPLNPRRACRPRRPPRPPPVPPLAPPQGAARGERVLRVASTAGLAVGSWYRLLMRDPGDGSLIAELNGGLVPATPAQRGAPDPVRFLTRVVAAGPDWVRTERAVPVKVRDRGTVDLRWSPELHRYAPMFTDAGFENFTLDFPWTPYEGHFKERGWNGLHLNQVSHGWVRGVGVNNSDMGVYLWGCTFTTIDDLRLSNSAPRGWLNGHRGIWMEHGSDCLVKNFVITHRFVHDVTVAGTEHGSVFSGGRGLDLNLDAHRSSPYANLFTDIALGLGTRPFEASGDAAWGVTHSAAYATFHNLSASLRFRLPRPDYGPLVTAVGLATDDTEQPPGMGWHVEPAPRAPHPRNLHVEMARTRAWRNPAA
ncbi:hypothetical protein HT031_000492 [Scenedesmus sp. PABB004]|nr:hypothetical protein HT031_000492 [Scenedesmus sp. PABB004]